MSKYLTLMLSEEDRDFLVDYVKTVKKTRVFVVIQTLLQLTDDDLKAAEKKLLDQPIQDDYVRLVCDYGKMASHEEIENHITGFRSRFVRFREVLGVAIVSKIKGE